MTNQTKEQTESMKQSIIGVPVSDLYYEEDGDYFVMEFKNGCECCFRFMTDLINEGEE